MKTTRIVRASTKGQITLPKTWRDKVQTDTFLIKIKNGEAMLTLIPIHMGHLEENVIFDADRDNEGKGLKPEAIIRMIKKIRNE